MDTLKELRAECDDTVKTPQWIRSFIRRLFATLETAEQTSEEIFTIAMQHQTGRKKAETQVAALREALEAAQYWIGWRPESDVRIAQCETVRKLASRVLEETKP